MVYISGVNLSKASQDKLVAAALAAAADLGYCAETVNVLSEMGFDIPMSTATILIEVEFRFPAGTNIENELDNIQVDYDGYIDDFEYGIPKRSIKK